MAQHPILTVSVELPLAVAAKEVLPGLMRGMLLASRRCQDGFRFRLVGSPNQSVQSRGEEVAPAQLTRLLAERTLADYFLFCHSVSFYSLLKQQTLNAPLMSE